MPPTTVAPSRRRWFLAPVLLVLACGSDGPAGGPDTAGSGPDGAAGGDAPGLPGDARGADTPGGGAADTGPAPGDGGSPTDAPAIAGDVGSVSLPGCSVVRTLSLAESRAYAPLAMGDRWTYRGQSRSMAGTAVEFQQRLEVTGVKQVGGTQAIVVSDSNPSGSPFPSEEYLQVSDAGLINHGVPPGAELPGSSAEVFPFTEVQFPVQVCAAFEQFRKPMGRGALVSVAVARSLETTTVSGISFTEALRVERTVTTEEPRDGGPPLVRQVASQVDWYAPGLGRIKRTLTTPERELRFDLTGALVGGKGRGVLPAGNIAQVDVDDTFLGDEDDRPAVVSDGERFLVLSSMSKSDYDGGLAAILVGPDGRTIKTTPVVQGGRVPISPAAAYGEGRYLVVYPTYNSTLKAVMLGADGAQQGAAFDIWGGGPVAVAYGQGVFLVASRHENSIGITIVSGQGAVMGEVKPYPGQRQGSPALAFDGKNFLLAWLNTTDELPNGSSTHVAAGRINAGGNAIDVNLTQVTSAPPLQESLDLAFDGTRYVLVWLHRASPSLIGGGDIRIARLGVDGKLLDPDGRVIAPQRTDTGKVRPRIARVGPQTLVVWERINYQGLGQSVWIAGTRVDADGNSLDSSAMDDGLFLSVQPVGPGSQPIVPAIGSGGSRALLVYVDRTGESTTKKRRIDGTVILPW